ncbi:urease accessory protein UreF [Celeribacter sp.]|uniref:urease accessory protein UreF n=1 Tax=Celeribacter sp. TaxID=1890673 RepID=UPI003A94386D
MTDAALLTLTQWLSPAFPLGAFAYSHGLELAISEGHVRDAETLEAWLAQTLRVGGGKVDAWLLAMVLDGADAVEMDDLAQALAGTKERWSETTEQGAAFARTVVQMGGPDRAAAALPVAVGVAARELNLPKKTVISLYLHSYISNLVSAGVRFMPLGQSAGQSVLSRLHAVIEGVAEGALDATVEGLTTSAFASDLGSARHEAMDVRIFKT